MCQVCELPGGIRVLGENVQPLVTVSIGRHTAAGSVEFENGRVIIMDAGPLRKSAVYLGQFREQFLPWLLRQESKLGIPEGTD